MPDLTAPWQEVQGQRGRAGAGGCGRSVYWTAQLTLLRSSCHAACRTAQYGMQAAQQPTRSGHGLPHKNRPRTRVSLAAVARQAQNAHGVKAVLANKLGCCARCAIPAAVVNDDHLQQGPSAS